MKSVDRVVRGISLYYDECIRPSLSGSKSVLYGVIIGSVLSHPDRLIGRYEGMLRTLGLMDDTGIDVDSLAAELRKQMMKGDGTLPIHVLNDDFKFTSSDVDQLISCIERC